MARGAPAAQQFAKHGYKTIRPTSVSWLQSSSLLVFTEWLSVSLRVSAQRQLPAADIADCQRKAPGFVWYKRSESPRAES